MTNLVLPPTDVNTVNRPDFWTAMRQDAPIYALSLMLVVVAYILRSWAGPTLGGQALYLFFVPPVVPV